MTLHWIRHGETTAPDNRCVGHEDVSLSEPGQQSIDRLGTTWTGPPPDRIVSSDLIRAKASAELLSERWNAPVETTDRLRELDFGNWTGRSWDAIEADDEERLYAWMEDWVETAPPEGESFKDLSTRVVGWLNDLRAEGTDDDSVIVVAHAGPIRAVLCHTLDLPLTRAFRLQIDCGSVSTLAPGQMDGTVVCLNSTQFRRPSVP